MKIHELDDEDGRGFVVLKKIKSVACEKHDDEERWYILIAFDNRLYYKLSYAKKDKAELEYVKLMLAVKECHE